MEIVRKDLIAAREGNMVFQFGGENCAWWPQERLKELLDLKENEDNAASGGAVPNLFMAPILNSKPNIQPLKTIFSLCRLLPKYIQNIVLKIVAFILGAWRGMFIEIGGKRVFKSMSNSCFKVDCEMYHPAVLHNRIQNNEIEGKVIFGHHMAVQR